MLRPDSRREQETKGSGADIFFFFFLCSVYLFCKRGRVFLSSSLLG